jgi:hypothetical protein
MTTCAATRVRIPNGIAGHACTIQPVLAERFDIHGTKAQGVRTKAVKELEARGLVRRDDPRSTKVWILSD